MYFEYVTFRIVQTSFKDLIFSFASKEQIIKHIDILIIAYRLLNIFTPFDVMFMAEAI